MEKGHDLPQVLRTTLALGIGLAVTSFASCSSEAPGSQVPPGGGSGAAGASGASGGASGSLGVGGVSGSGVGAISFGGASSGASGAGGRIEDGSACAGNVVEGTRSPSIVLFVIDRSGSMTCNPPPLQDSARCESRPEPADPNQPSKWSVVSKAIKQAIAGLPSNATVGITFFNKDDICGVGAPAGLGTYSADVALRTLDMAQLEAINASIDGVKPRGETPIVAASTTGYEILRLADVPGSKFLVLLTDGVDTCTAAKDRTDFLAQTVPRAFQLGIRSFVIGAPGSEGGRGFLSQMAYNGGTATNRSCDHANVQPTVGNCHFDMSQTMDFAAALNGALDQIAASAVSCELDMPKPDDGGPLDVAKVNVDLSGPNGMEPLFQDNSASCNAGADGWQYNADKTKIILCGNACAKYKSRGTSVSIQLGCRARVR
jgi:hypothetical protein